MPSGRAKLTSARLRASQADIVELNRGTPTRETLSSGSLPARRIAQRGAGSHRCRPGVLLFGPVHEGNCHDQHRGHSHLARDVPGERRGVASPQPPQGPAAHRYLEDHDEAHGDKDESGDVQAEPPAETQPGHAEGDASCPAARSALLYRVVAVMAGAPCEEMRSRNQRLDASAEPRCGTGGVAATTQWGAASSPPPWATSIR